MALTSIAKEQLTVTNGAVVTFTAATFTKEVVMAFVAVADAPVRTCNSADPSTTTGITWKAGTKFEVWGYTDVLNFGVIATTATNATLDVEYFGTP